MAASNASTRVAGLPGRAQAYLAAVALATVGAAVPALAGMTVDRTDLLTFALLALGAAIAQTGVIEISKNHGFPVAIAFVTAAALLLPLGLVALIALAQHAPDIVRRKYPWYIQTFNTSNFTLNVLAAAVVARAFADIDATDAGRYAVAGLAACLVLVATNHVLLATMLRLARGHSFRESGLFSPESLSIDFVLAALGVTLAALATSNPALVVGTIAPLLLVHRLLRFEQTARANRAPARAR